MMESLRIHDENIAKYKYIYKIDDLPDEILEMVLGELSPPLHAFHEGQEANPVTDFAEFSSYLRVCKRWRRIYEPFFYNFPHLGRSGWDRPKITSRLLTTLIDRPDLQACVKRLEITPWIFTPGIPRQHQEIIQLCKPSLRSALLFTNWQSQAAWMLVNALQNHNLHTLDIRGGTNGIGLQVLINRLDSPTLRTLKLRRYGCLNDHDTTPGMSMFDADVTSTRRLINELNRRAGQSSITTLICNEKTAEPGVTQALVAWPARLMELELTGLPESIPGDYLNYSANQVQQMLEPHQESLEKLRLGVMNGGNGGNFFPHLARFPRLRWLRVPSQSLFDEDPVSATVWSKSSVLRRLDVAFYLFGAFSRGVTEGFRLRHKEWLIQFGRTLAMEVAPSEPPPYDSLFSASTSVAPSSSSSSEENKEESSSSDSDESSSADEEDVTRRTMPVPLLSHGLNTISIQFIPGSAEEIKKHFLYPSSGDSEVEVTRPWPWMHMKDAAKILRPLGVRVLYEPSISQQEWRRMVKARGSRSWMG